MGRIVKMLMGEVWGGEWMGRCSERRTGLFRGLTVTGGNLEGYDNPIYERTMGGKHAILEYLYPDINGQPFDPSALLSHLAPCQRPRDQF